MRIAQVLPLATLAVFAIAAPAAAATVAVATTPLNIRSGPGPQYPVIGAIAANSQAVVNGCIQGSLWCEVSFGRVQGWVYSQYLRTSVAGAAPVVLSQRAASVPVVTYQPSTVETVGAAPPAAGAVIVEPAGTPPMPLNPPPAVNSYVTSHPVQPGFSMAKSCSAADCPPTSRSMRCRTTNTTMPTSTGYRYWSSRRRGGSSIFTASLSSRS